ncbi:hypothetical protein SynBIOSE41_02645 [Synechococcus sp. BIOS-E4-1]|nr:hypothetical protein SynBIOSE41_02645 [Synechococcus sp. BIOS-E4-1]
MTSERHPSSGCAGRSLIILPDVVSKTTVKTCSQRQQRNDSRSQPPDHGSWRDGW